MALTDEGHIREVLRLHNTVLRDAVGETVRNESFRDLLLATLDEARDHIDAIRVKGDSKRKETQQ